MNRSPTGDLAHFAGVRYWTASALPALVGTTLPFWLRPPGFSFRWLPAVEFLAATVLCHAGFSFLLAFFECRSTTWTRRRLLSSAVACLAAACLVGLHLDASLPRSPGVPAYIFIVYGVSALFAGVLYVAPPFDFRRRPGGEIVLAYGFGLIPALGAWLVQVGDIARKVYVALLPVVVVTALWVWTDELSSLQDDAARGRGTLVVWLGSRFSGTLVTLAIAGLFYASLVLTVATGSMSPWALVALLLSPLIWTIVRVSWRAHDNPGELVVARGRAIALHGVTGLTLAASPVLDLLFRR
jgi:1,4-dihydroxy-2-naphthoate octaprenyltransferase